MSKKRRKNNHNMDKSNVIHTDNAIHVQLNESEASDMVEHKDNVNIPNEPEDMSGVCYPQYLNNMDTGITMTKFAPMSMGKDIVTLISTKLHERLMATGYTFAEVGYLNRASVLSDEGVIHVRMYFDPELATTQELVGNGQMVRKLHPALRKLNGYFFYVEDENNASSVAKIVRELVPKYNYHTDENHLTAIDYESMNMEKLKFRDVLVIECNFPMTIAYILDVDLADPNFRVWASAIGGLENQKKKKKAIGYMEMISIETLPITIHPVWVFAQHSIRTVENQAYVGYKTESVYPYLISQMNDIETGNESNRKKLEHEANNADKRDGVTKTILGDAITKDKRKKVVKYC